MKLTRVLLSLLLGAVLWGCDGAVQPSADPEITPGAEPQVPDVQPAQPLSSQTADALMAEIIDAINQGDVGYLLPYLLQRDQNTANVEAALLDYRTYFNDEEIVRFERQDVEQLGETNTQQPIQRFNYRISSESGISKNIALYQDESIRLVDEFFNYSYWATSLLERFIETIQAGNAEQLAQVLTVDDQPYPVEDAEQAIANYEALFDVETLQYQFSDLASDLTEDLNGFIYILSGTDNAGSPIEHSVTVTYGDGLVGLQDELVP